MNQQTQSKQLKIIYIKQNKKDDTDFYILFIIGIIISIIIIYYFKIKGNKSDNNINLRYKNYYGNDLSNSDLGETLLPLSTTNKIETYEEEKSYIDNNGFVNELIKYKPHYETNSTDEYLSQFKNISSEIPQKQETYVGFCPKPKESGKQLPMANINVNCL